MINYNWFRPENRFMAGLPLRKRSGRLFLFFFYIYRKKKPGIHPGRTGETRRACAARNERSLRRKLQAGPVPQEKAGPVQQGSTGGIGVFDRPACILTSLIVY